MNASGEPIYYYGVKGERLGVYNFIVGYYAGGATPTLENSTTSTETYFGARRLAPLDRLGSARSVNGGFASYYPFGEDKSTNATGDAWRFGTYWRDSISGLDYAVNRFYSSALGRFMTPDPYKAAGGPSAPQSWNRYAYVGGDPVNAGDPSGLDATAEQCIEDPLYCEGSTAPGNQSCSTDIGDGYVPLPSPTCQSGDGDPPVIQGPTAPPCNWDTDNIDTALSNLGNDILSITAAKDTAATALDLQNLAVTLGEIISDEEWGPGPYFNGGHYALDLSLSDVQADFEDSPLAYADFKKLFDPHGHGRRYPKPVPTTDPFHTYYLHDHNNNGVLDFHFDRYNPYHPIGLGTVQHGAYDVLWGHFGVHCLDPAWSSTAINIPF